jgi:hypothetical protein
LEIEATAQATLESKLLQARLDEAQNSIAGLTARLTAKPQIEQERASEVQKEWAKTKSRR